MIKRYQSILMLFPGLMLLLFYACKPASDKYTSPPGYDFTQADKFNMPESLLEISGIAFYQGDGGTLYSIQDEDGKLFKQNWGVKKQQHVKFAPKGDYEDLALMGNRVFVLKSSGNIYGFLLGTMEEEEVRDVKAWKKNVPKGEYEGMYADEASQELYVLCKDCKTDKKKNRVSGYVLKYDAAGNMLTKASAFEIDVSTLKDLGKPSRLDFKPSALSRHPQSGDWYILSSVNKMLLIAGDDWKIKAIHHLSPSVFNQPEGMAFDKQLNLYISNEGDELSSGNVLKFTFQQAPK